MGQAQLLEHAVRSEAEAAILFVHGFGGDAMATWGKFPQLIRDEAHSLSDWSIYSVGYQSTLAPDIRGVWAGDPGIETLATYLRARADQQPLKKYKSLALIAHSMGGLVVQKALVDSEDLAGRVSHVIFFGTPSRGLKKAAGFLGRLFKRQTDDMGLASGFIVGLRDAWRRSFGDIEEPLDHPSDRPFRLWTVAGDRDEFVPASSSLSCFQIDERIVVPGNHLEIVKPGEYASMSVQAVVDGIVGEAAPGGPGNAARVAVEMGEFNRAIDLFMPHVGDLDGPSIVQLALALDAVGRRADAIEVLKRNGKQGTDALGVLGGRYKRQWMAEGLREPAKKALALYEEAYDLSVRAGDDEQAFYHGINIAFMRFAFERDEDAARVKAREVLEHTARAKKKRNNVDVWRIATEGEANLYLGEVATAMSFYGEAVATNPEPWQMESMYIQAMRIVEAMDDGQAQKELRRIFQRSD